MALYKIIGTQNKQYIMSNHSHSLNGLNLAAKNILYPLYH